MEGAARTAERIALERKRVVAIVDLLWWVGVCAMCCLTAMERMEAEVRHRGSEHELFKARLMSFACHRIRFHVASVSTPKTRLITYIVLFCETCTRFAIPM